MAGWQHSAKRTLRSDNDPLPAVRSEEFYLGPIGWSVIRARFTVPCH
jgi:hypothetical protein